MGAGLRLDSVSGGACGDAPLRFILSAVMLCFCLIISQDNKGNHRLCNRPVVLIYRWQMNPETMEVLHNAHAISSAGYHCL